MIGNTVIKYDIPRCPILDFKSHKHLNPQTLFSYDLSIYFILFPSLCVYSITPNIANP
jgi:hypothetical protein